LLDKIAKRVIVLREIVTLTLTRKGGRAFSASGKFEEGT